MHNVIFTCQLHISVGLTEMQPRIHRCLLITNQKSKDFQAGLDRLDSFAQRQENAVLVGKEEVQGLAVNDLAWVERLQIGAGAVGIAMNMRASQRVD